MSKLPVVIELAYSLGFRGRRRKAYGGLMLSARGSPFEWVPIFQRLTKPTSKFRPKAPAAAQVRTGVGAGNPGTTEHP